MIHVGTDMNSFLVLGSVVCGLEEDTGVVCVVKWIFNLLITEDML